MSKSNSAIAAAAGVTSRVTRKMRLIRKQQNLTTDPSEPTVNTSYQDAHNLFQNSSSIMNENTPHVLTPKNVYHSNTTY